MIRVALVAFALALTGPAFAKGKDKPAGHVEMTGLASFDAVFTKVDAIDSKLDAARKDLSEANRDLNTALGLDKGTPLQEGLAAFAAEAAGKFEVVTTGGVPRLEPSGAVPPDVAAAIDAVNGLTSVITETIPGLKTIPADAAKLVKATAELPKQFKSEAKAAGLAPTEIPAKLKIVKQDVAIAAALPEKAAAVVGRMTDLLATIGSLAG